MLHPEHFSQKEKRIISCLMQQPLIHSLSEPIYSSFNSCNCLGQTDVTKCCFCVRSKFKAGRVREEQVLFWPRSACRLCSHEKPVIVLYEKVTVVTFAF